MIFYFDEPRLHFNIVSRLLIKTIIWSAYIVATASALVLLFLHFSDLRQLWWLGLLMALFLADRFWHSKRADHSLIELKNIPPSSNKKINLARYLTPLSFDYIENAFGRVCLLGGEFELELLKNLVWEKDIKESFQRLEISLPDFFQKIEEESKKAAGESSQPKEILNRLEKIILKALEEAILTNEDFIRPRNILIGLFSIRNNSLDKLSDLFSLSLEELREVLVFGRYQQSFPGWRSLPAGLGGFIHRSYNIRHRTVNRAWTSRPTPILDKYGFDLTDLARLEKIGFLIGHEKEYKQMVDVLCRPVKPAVLLVGEPGVGKEAIVNHLAYQITKDRIPALFDRRVVSLELGSLVAKAAPEELSSRLKQITEEIIQAANIILFIPDIDNLVKTSGEHFLSACDILLPAIKSGTFPVIGITYPREFRQCIEPQTDFAAAFEVIRVEEVSPAEALKILVYDSLILENQFRIRIKFRAIKQAVDLAHRYLHNKPLPSGAEEVLKEALADVYGQHRKILEVEDVIKMVERQTKIPIQQAGSAEINKLLNLEELIHQRLINQEEAVKAVSRALREYRSGLTRRGGPIACFLFVGPTGVGKTELSKILAQIQFGSEDLMLRFDMSEYQEKQSLYRFIGSPDGKISGSLTEAISQHPYSLLLLDEFEKAHPDILNLFLQVFDDGRLTDNLGQLVDFQNTIIIATSNAHSELIKNEIEEGKTMNSIAELLKQKLTDYFKPELINRFSAIIVFRSLEFSEIIVIAGLQLNDLAKMLRETHGIDLQFKNEVIEKTAELGYSPVFGARPLRQVISDNFRSALAEKILRKEIKKGDIVEIILENNEFRFKIGN